MLIKLFYSDRSRLPMVTPVKMGSWLKFPFISKIWVKFPFISKIWESKQPVVEVGSIFRSCITRLDCTRHLQISAELTILILVDLFVSSNFSLTLTPIFHPHCSLLTFSKLQAHIHSSSKPPIHTAGTNLCVNAHASIHICMQHQLFGWLTHSS